MAFRVKTSIQAKRDLAPFSRGCCRKGPEKLTVHILDLVHKDLRDLPESKGLWSPRWSPDGQFISAMSADFHRLLLFDCAAKTWQTLTTAAKINDPAWSRDSRFLHFWAQGPVAGSQPPDATSAVYRISISSRRIQRLAVVSDLDPINEPWYGVAPDGSPLAVRGVRSEEIYALKLR